MQHPQKIETVHVETLDNELCIYDWQRLEVHNLNPTAATVWQLCDGQTSPQQMAARLPGDLTPAQAEELVWLTLARLEKAHLLQEAVVKPTGHKTLTRRELLKGLGVTAALLPVISSIVAPGPVEAQSPVPTATGTLTPTTTPIVTPTPTATAIRSQTFNFTGVEQQFTVPTGVTSVTIEAFGAEGGAATLGAGLVAQGGRSVATIAVTAGETLFVYVGGRGGDGAVGSPGAGGFNGGGGSANAIGSSEGGGGGGASDVRQGGNGLANRVLVAGGGGGGGASGGASGTVPGGNGGGTTGADGQIGQSNGGGGGGGGTQSSGGTGGTGVGGSPSGASGSLGVGGAGGGGNPLSVSGGGGGGGYFGGGGGGSADLTGGNAVGGGGGGGGSSFAIPTATGVTHQQGVRSGDGQVVISW